MLDCWKQMQSRSASFFNKLASLSTEVRSLANQVHADAARARVLVEHKVELDRIYKQMESSATRGAIRLLLPQEDPLWKNEAVQHELRLQGFAVSEKYHQGQGAIEWWHTKERS
jgi:hypothetical protein